MYDGDGRILVAHIASPGTVRNIESEPRVCLSFITFVERLLKQIVEIHIEIEGKWKLNQNHPVERRKKGH